MKLLSPSRRPLDELSRRSLVRFMVAVAAATSPATRLASADEPGSGPSSALPQFDADGRLVVANGYSEETAFRTVTGDGASVRVLGPWKTTPSGGWTDPVLGSAATMMTMSSQATTLTKTADLGKPERVSLVSALSLDKDLIRADLVAAAVRQQAGTVYYEYDLAIPATDCVPELATACLPSRVVLISCAVQDGRLHLFQVDANPDEWRRAGKALKNLRSTFAISTA